LLQQRAEQRGLARRHRGNHAQGGGDGWLQGMFDRTDLAAGRVQVPQRLQSADDVQCGALACLPMGRQAALFGGPPGKLHRARLACGQGLDRGVRIQEQVPGAQHQREQFAALLALEQ